jgi:hypothetical protein
LVVQLAQVQTGFSLYDAPNAVLYLLQVGFVHALEVLPQPTIGHHLLQDLLEDGFLNGK